MKPYVKDELVGKGKFKKNRNPKNRTSAQEAKNANRSRKKTVRQKAKSETKEELNRRLNKMNLNDLAKHFGFEDYQSMSDYDMLTYG